MKPSEATSAVIRTGRRRVSAPVLMASSSPMPSSRSVRINDSMTSPFNTATPDSAMKPTAAEMDIGISRNQSAKMPPVRANGIPVKTSRPSLTLLNITKSSVNTRNSASGTTTRRRWVADCNCSKVPPQLVQYPGGIFTSFNIRRSASATNVPMSRPRTLALTTMRRLPFSLLIWFGPGAKSSVATSASGM